MKTVVVLAGNSDNKLTQQEWHTFIGAILDLVETFDGISEVHFAAPAIGWSCWQNACFVFEVRSDRIPRLRAELTDLRSEFKQESIALLIGDTEFV